MWVKEKVSKETHVTQRLGQNETEYTELHSTVIKETYTALKKKGLQSTTQVPSPVTGKVREKKKPKTRNKNRTQSKHWNGKKRREIKNEKGKQW